MSICWFCFEVNLPLLLFQVWLPQRPLMIATLVGTISEELFEGSELYTCISIPPERTNHESERIVYQNIVKHLQHALALPMSYDLVACSGTFMFTPLTENLDIYGATCSCINVSCNSNYLYLSTLTIHSQLHDQPCGHMQKWVC